MTLSLVGGVYRCETANIPTSSGTVVTGIFGIHLSGKDNNDVTYLHIEGNKTLSFVPRNISNFFPNIKALRIWYTTIQTLAGNEFDEFPQLEYFDFRRSNLTTISSTLFQKTPKIVLVWFDANMIERVGHDLFTPLNVTQLKDVDFKFNRCISRRGENQTEIISLINDLRAQCPFDD